MSKKIQNNNISPASTQAQAKSANGFRYRLTRTVASSALVGALFGIIVGYAGGYLTTMGNNNQNKASANVPISKIKDGDGNFNFAQRSKRPNKSLIQYKQDPTNSDTLTYKFTSHICGDVGTVNATKSSTLGGVFPVNRPVTLTVTCEPNKYKSQVAGNSEDGSSTGEINLRTLLGNSDFAKVNGGDIFRKAKNGLNPFIIKYTMPSGYEEMMVYGKKETFGENNLNNSNPLDDGNKGKHTRSDTAFTKVNYSYNPKNGQFTYTARTRDIRCGRILGSNLNVVTPNDDVYKGRYELGIRRVLEITLDCEQGTVYRPGLQESDYISTSEMKFNSVNATNSLKKMNLKGVFHIDNVKDKFFKDPNAFVAVKINSMNPVDVAASTKKYKSGSKSVGDYRNIKVNYRMNGDNRSSGDLDDTLNVQVRNPLCKTGKLNVKKLSKAQMDDKYGALKGRSFGYEVNMTCVKVLTEGDDKGKFFDETINIASANSNTSSLMLTEQEIRELNNNKPKFEHYFKFNTNIAKSRNIVKNSAISSGWLDFSQKPLKSDDDTQRMSSDESNNIITKIRFKDNEAKIRNVDFRSNCREVNLSANPFRVVFANGQPKFIFKFVCEGKLGKVTRLQKPINVATGVNIKERIDIAVDDSNVPNKNKDSFKKEMYKKFNLDPRSFVEFEFEFEER